MKSCNDGAFVRIVLLPVMKPQLVKPDPSSEDSLSVKLNKPEKRKSYTVPLLIAAAVHVVAIGAIAMSLNGKHTPEQKAEPPALRIEPKAVVAPPASVLPAPVQQAAPQTPPPATSIAAAPEPAAEKPADKPAPGPVAKKAPARAEKAKATAKKTARASKAVQGKVAKSKAAKAKAARTAKPRPAPKKKAAPQKKTGTLDLDALSKMGAARHYTNGIK